MARRVHFPVAARSMFALALLISLSATAECLQCYWCGPLAEQVHRSPRAAPCIDLENQVTVCEPGYTHCAVVATSPPYIESRYCVKFYQDECYKLYCNTTKTFKTTCPCQGELCNGKNTQREKDAFAILAKTVGEPQNTKIIKKRNAVLSNVRSSHEMESLVQEDMDANSHDNDSIVLETDKVNDLYENNIDKANDTKLDANGSEMQGDQPVDEAEQVDTNVPNDMNDLQKANKHNEPEPNNEKIENEPPLNETKATTTHLVLEDKNVDLHTTSKVIELTTVAVQTMKMEDNSFINNDMKPNMQGPTAEALQQNSEALVVTSSVVTEKASEQTSESTILMSTVENDVHPTANPTDSKKNNAPEVSFTFNLLIIGSIVLKYGV